jgi:hypothetical protein
MVAVAVPVPVPGCGWDHAADGDCANNCATSRSVQCHKRIVETGKN